MPVSGGKEELTDRIAYFLETGKVKKAIVKSRKAVNVGDIEPDTIIEDNFVCSEKHRAFFKKYIGNSFSFNVAFQKWLKSNAGKTYHEAILAYDQIMKDKKRSKTVIDKQFEYNTYIRDFFADNKGKTLDDAIKCWKYKKQMKGYNRYEKSDLAAVK